MMKTILSLLLLLPSIQLYAASGTWLSKVTGGSISYKSHQSANAAKDASGRLMTVVYLENLSCEKIGQNSNKDDVAWLLNNGYQVVELDYNHHASAISPNINEDIIAINDDLATGSFCGLSNISSSRAYVLFEGYRISRDVSYCKDNPSVYNLPDGYVIGDSLYMDIVYPANPKREVPAILSFSYSNSYHGKEHQRMYLPYTFSMFDDSILEGLPGIGYAWAIADHPKYCDWGNGKYAGGPNKSLSSIEVCPDAAQKVRNAVRTLRHVGRTSLGLSSYIGLYGFSRGSTAASLAIGDAPFPEWLSPDGCRCDAIYETSDIQIAVLGPGVFDYSLMKQDSREYQNITRFCSAGKGRLEEQGGALAIQQSAVPCFLFYNSDDDANYDIQARHLMSLLDRTGVRYQLLRDFSTGHAVPSVTTDIGQIYNFLQSNGLATHVAPLSAGSRSADTTYTIGGQLVYNLSSQPHGVYIVNGTKVLR